MAHGVERLPEVHKSAAERCPPLLRSLRQMVQHKDRPAGRPKAAMVHTAQAVGLAPGGRLVMCASSSIEKTLASREPMVMQQCWS